MTLKTYTIVLAFIVYLMSGFASAGLIKYDMDFGADGSGSFYIDELDLAAIPATGLYFSPANKVTNFTANVFGDIYDIEHGGQFNFAASDGLNSGVTGISNSQYRNSVTNNILQLHTCGGIVCQVTANGVSTSYSLQKAVQSVPEPSTLAIFALGMIGLASRRFKKQS